MPNSGSKYVINRIVRPLYTLNYYPHDYSYVILTLGDNMPRGKARQDTDMLAMALIGYEQQKIKIDEKIRDIKALIGGARKPSGEAAPAVHAAPVKTKRKRVLSAEARKRIATAQKRRWAEHRKNLAQSE
jgi:hypothetical protein